MTYIAAALTLGFAGTAQASEQWQFDEATGTLTFTPVGNPYKGGIIDWSVGGNPQGIGAGCLTCDHPPGYPDSLPDTVDRLVIRMTHRGRGELHRIQDIARSGIPIHVESDNPRATLTIETYTPQGPLRVRGVGHGLDLNGDGRINITFAPSLLSYLTLIAEQRRLNNHIDLRHLRAFRQGPRTGAYIQTFGGNDTILGSPANDEIRAGGGNNRIWLGAGDDSVRTGNGNNRIWPVSGRSFISTGTGNDIVYRARGVRTIKTRGGINRLYGGSGRNDIEHSGRTGRSLIIGGPQRDQLGSYANGSILIANGGRGNILEGFGPRTLLRGGRGNDHFRTSPRSPARIDCGGGNRNRLYGPRPGVGGPYRLRNCHQYFHQGRWHPWPR
ncbi:calcium-binding protein [Aquisalimonas sp.]|uniref:calcium-binding protein n=1 Tax=Aquisalimonas sp. TaxID=1872621 RepID=UPI0025C29C80|nr:calcium-binding protein [Aquisalimonas sp.]